jgi:hypothetical protein
MVRKILGWLGLVAIGSAAFYIYERPRVATVPFAELPFSRVEYDGFVAPEGFPDCTVDMLDMRTERNANLTVRPKPGVQCGLEWFPDAWWVDANGVRHDPKRPARLVRPGRLLIMGAAGASDVGGVESACGLEPPLTYYMNFAGEPLKVGTVEKAECYGHGRRFYFASWLYRTGGLETPAGWLDATIEDLDIDATIASFTFVLRNDTPETIVLSRCPLLDVQFVPRGTVPIREAAYRTWLNCPAAPDALEPGDVVRFEIQAPLSGASGSGYLDVEYRDEDRVLDRIETDMVEVAG